MEVRDYRPADYPDVRQCLKAGGLYDPIWDSRKSLQAVVKMNPGSIFVALDSTVVGCCILVQQGQWAFIYELAVLPSYRKKGVGSLLLTEAERRLKKRGMVEAGLLVEGENPELMAFYSRRGWRKEKLYRAMVKKL